MPKDIKFTNYKDVPLDILQAEANIAGTVNEKLSWLTLGYAVGTHTDYHVYLNGTMMGVTIAPAALAATDVTDVSFTANWEQVANATGYELDISDDDFVTLIGDGLPIQIVGGSTVSYAVTGLTVGTEYKYRIRSLYEETRSGNGAEITQSTLSNIDLFWIAYNDPNEENIELIHSMSEADLLALLLSVYSEYVTLMAYEQYIDEGVVTLEIDAEADNALGAEIIGYINGMEA